MGKDWVVKEAWEGQGLAESRRDLAWGPTSHYCTNLFIFTLGHNNFQEPMLILVMSIEVGSQYLFSYKIDVGDCFTLCSFCPTSNTQCGGRKSS